MWPWMENHSKTTLEKSSKKTKDFLNYHLAKQGDFLFRSSVLKVHYLLWVEIIVEIRRILCFIKQSTLY